MKRNNKTKELDNLFRLLIGYIDEKLTLDRFHKLIDGLQASHTEIDKALRSEMKSREYFFHFLFFITGLIIGIILK